MIYQFNDSTKPTSSDADTEPSSTIYCNSINAMQATSTGAHLTTAVSLPKKSNQPTTMARSGVGGVGSNSLIYDEHHGQHRKMDLIDYGGGGGVGVGAATNVSEIISNRSSRMSTHTPGGGSQHGGGGSSSHHHHHHHHRSHARSRHTSAYDNSDSSSSKSTVSTYGSTCTDSSCSGSESSSTSGEPNLPYPGFPEISMRYLRQDTRPRNWCLLLITNPWFERISILVILFNCITLGMYQPCVDDECVTNRCKILQVRVRWAPIDADRRRRCGGVRGRAGKRAVGRSNRSHRQIGHWHRQWRRQS